MTLLMSRACALPVRNSFNVERSVGTSTTATISPCCANSSRERTRKLPPRRMRSGLRLMAPSPPENRITLAKGCSGRSNAKGCRAPSCPAVVTYSAWYGPGVAMGSDVAGPAASLTPMDAQAATNASTATISRLARAQQWGNAAVSTGCRWIARGARNRLGCEVDFMNAPLQQSLLLFLAAAALRELD